MSDSLYTSPTRVLAPSSAECDGDAALPVWVGRYHILGEIARGGMGVVARASDPVLGRELAVKVLLARHREQPDLARRFLAEARVMGRLQHPGVPAVHEVGRLADGRPFIAMKLVEGRTLAELLGHKAAAPEDLPRFVMVFEQVCQTMAFAHSRGVTHCDLKPSNVMVGAFGEVQVMDWGLASAEDPAAAPQAETSGDVFGTPAYMPPEQARGEHAGIGPACDVFALGAMLCEILTGRPPYLGRSTTRVFQKAIDADVQEALGRVDGSGADHELAALAKACLAPRPQDRPADAAAVADALTRYLVGVRERLRTADLERASAQAREATRRRARWQRFALAASLLVIGVMLAGVWSWRARVAAAEARDVAAAAADVEANLREAARLQNEAKWGEARAALARAEGKLDRCGVDDLRRVRQVRADLEVVARLDEAAVEETQVRDGSFDSDGAAAAYTAAFHEYGIDFDELSPEEAARRIRGSAACDPLIAGLDRWCVAAPPDAANRDRLFTAANLADPDAWRTRFRDAVRDRDRAAMGQLAEAAGASSVPRETAVLLSEAPLIPARPTEMAALRAVQRAFPDEFFINVQLGQALRVTRPPQTEEAVGFLRVAAALRPQSPGARENLGGALLELNRFDEAEVCFREALRLKPDYVEALYSLGETLDRLSRYSEARDAFQEGIRRRPNRSDMHNGLGNVLLHSGDRDAAAAEYRDAVRLDPHNASAHANLARSVHDKGDVDGAALEYRLSIRCNADHALPHYNLGTLLLNEKGQCAEAADEFREAVRCDPDYAEAHCNLGHALMRQGKVREGLASLRRGHELGLKKGDAWHYPSADWVRDGEHLVHLDDRLDALLGGAAPSGAPAETLELAQFCQHFKARYALAADLYAQSFDRAPDLMHDLDNDWRFQAACAAVQASTGRGVDAPGSEDRRACYRRDGLAWLRSDLAAWVLRPPGEARKTATAWRASADLAGVRDAESLAQLPPEDALNWRNFWDDVDATASPDKAP